MQEIGLLPLHLLFTQSPQRLECQRVDTIDLHDLHLLILLLLLLVEAVQFVQLQPNHLQVGVELVEREAFDVGSVNRVENEGLFYFIRGHTGNKDIEADLHVVVAELTHFPQVFL